MTAVALLMLAVALWCWPGPSPVLRPGRRAARSSTRVRHLVVAGVGALAVQTLLGLPWWTVPVGWGVAAAVLTRRRPRRSATTRTADRRLLAETGDLMAACLDGGLPPGRVLAEVLAVTGRRALEREPGTPDPWGLLGETAGLLRLGATAEVAWGAVALDPDLAGMAAVARRTDLGGAALAGGLRAWADDLRRQVEEAEGEAVGRVGVVLTAPLVCCFLPAFVCLGLAPVVLSLVESLDLF